MVEQEFRAGRLLARVLQVPQSQAANFTGSVNVDLARGFTYLLLGVHGFLGVWALVGFAEWFMVTTPWPEVSNELFPRPILFMQWALTLTAAAVFIGGYTVRWPRTPLVMACVYAAMAALCAIQTVTYMTSELRYLAMAAEYVAYTGIVVFLCRSSLFGSQLEAYASVH